MRLPPLFVACTITFLVYLGAFMRLPIIPLYAQAQGATLTQVGFITAAFMLAASAVAIPFGLTSDRLGRRRLVLLGAFINAAVSFLLPFAGQPYLILAVYALAGLGIAAYTPSIIAFVGDVSGSLSFGRAYGLYTTFMAVAMAVGPGFGGLIAGLAGFKGSFTLSGFIITAGLLFGLTAFPSTKRKEAALPSARILQEFRLLFANRVALVCFVSAFCLTFTWGITPAFIPLYAKSIGLSVFAIGLLFTAQSTASAAIRLPFGTLSDRLGRRMPFMFLGLLTAASATLFLTSSTNLPVLAALMGLVGLAMGMTFLSASALLAETTTQGGRGLAMGAYSTCFYAGMAASPALLGQVISAYGFQPGFSIAAAVSYAGLSIALFLAGGVGFRKVVG
ncbi:MFS transporter [Candidatus Hecatella orcuttiae]|jgi:MFS family permease|uniref:MFS transporter n=1 Tax=Candidatus Hecatella orcuttiae TaxID=1935119 RepID=UPI002867F154|nr:MFS transporter [Candidatus Hecatella orcuttiae]